MGYLALSPLPAAPESGEAKVLLDYVKRLHKVLAQWQTVFANTPFLGADGYLTISSSAPSDTDGHDGDVWIKTG